MGRGAALGSAAAWPFLQREPPWWAAVVVTLSALVPLLATVGVAPARTAAGAFVTLVVVPALQALAAAFFGRWAAVAVGGGVALLTLALVAGPPPEVHLPPSQRLVPLSAPLSARLAPPPAAAAQRVVAEGGRALLFVCLSRGDAADLTVTLADAQLREAPVPGAGAGCWKRFEVPGLILLGGTGPKEVTVAPLNGNAVDLVAGYSPARGERLFLELRVFNRDGRLVEIWV